MTTTLELLCILPKKIDLNLSFGEKKRVNLTKLKTFMIYDMIYDILFFVPRSSWEILHEIAGYLESRIVFESDP